MSDVGVAYVQLLPSMRGFGPAVQKELGSGMTDTMNKAGAKSGGSFMTGFGQGVQRVGREVSGVGDKMTVGLTLPLLAAGNAATNFARDTGENLNKVRVVFGDGAKAVERFAQTSASSYGISQRAALEATGTYGNMFDQIGFGSDQAADMSVSMVQMAADFASFNNLETEQVLEAQAAAFRGEYDALQRVVPTINAAAVQTKALAMTGKENADELTAQEKAAATYAFIMENAGAATGDFARTSEDLANAERIAAAEAEDAAAAFGEKLLPIKLQLVQAIGQVLDKFNSLSPAQQDAILKAGMAAAAFGPLLSIFGRVATGVGALIRGFGALGRGLAGVVRFGVSAGVGVGKAAAAFGRLALAAGRAALAVGRAALQMAVSAAKATARVVAQVAIQIGKWILLGVQSLLAAAKVALAWIISLGPIGLVVAAVIAAVALIIANWDKVVAFITTAASWIWEKVTTIFTAIKDWVGARINDIVNFVAALPGRVAGFVSAVYQWFVDRFTAIATWVGAKIDAIVGFIGSLPGRVIGFLTTVYQYFVQKFNAAKQWVSSVIDRIVAFIGTLPGKAMSYLNRVYSGWVRIFNLIKTNSKRIIDGVIGFFRGIPGRVRSAISGIADIILGPFRTAFNAIKRLWNSTVGGFGFSVPDWIPGVGGKGFKIPRMHSGGIFQAPTGNEGMALLRSGERVLTESDQRQMGRYGGGAAPAQVEIMFTGRNNDLLARWIRQNTRVKGGSVQRAWS